MQYFGIALQFTKENQFCMSKSLNSGKRRTLNSEEKNLNKRGHSEEALRYSEQKFCQNSNVFSYNKQ